MIKKKRSRRTHVDSLFKAVMTDTLGAVEDIVVAKERNLILFWSPSKRPQDAVKPRHHVPPEHRRRLVKLLQRGNILMRYMGRAECRICGVELGSADVGDFGLTWPEQAEHYILEHGVWNEDCDRLLAAAGKAGQ